MNENLINKSVEDLVQTIKGAESFKIYTEMKQSVLKNPQLVAKIAEYKDLNHKIQTKKLSEIEPTFDEEKHVSSVYWTLMLDENAKAFLESEKELSFLLSEVFSKVTNEIGLDVNIFV